MLDKKTKDELGKIITAYNTQIGKIRRNPLLSDQGKRQAMAELYDATRRQVDAERRAAAATAAARRQQLERQLFRDTDAGSLSARDAADRADQIKTPAEALRLLKRCERTGDDALARAIFRRAWDAGAEELTNSAWGQVATTYLDRHAPQLRPVAEELAKILDGETRIARATEAMETSVNRPPELRGIHDVEITRMAAAAAATPDPQPQPVGHAPAGNAQTVQIHTPE